MSLFTLAKSAFSNFLCNVTHRFLTLQSESRHNFAYSEKFLPNTCLDLAFFRNTIKVTLSCFSRRIKFSVKTDGANSDISFLDFRYQEVECRMYFYFQLINVTTHKKAGFSRVFFGFYLCMFFFSIRYQWQRCVTDTQKNSWTERGWMEEEAALLRGTILDTSDIIMILWHNVYDIIVL